MTIRNELEHNYEVFQDQWLSELNSACEDSTKNEYFRESYVRIASLQSWRTILQSGVPNYSMLYFQEAQNDVLSGLILARLGSWRISLKSLRSCLENIGRFIYYSEHPVENRQSLLNKHKFSFQEFIKYLELYPHNLSISNNINPIGGMKSEYATLSKAVHSSGERFRMSSHGSLPQMWVDSDSDRNQWIVREKSIVKAINLLFLRFYYEKIQGTVFHDQRLVISEGLPGSSYTEIFEKYQVRF